MQINYETHINQAVGWLEYINQKNGGLLNGNFSKAGEIYKVKVCDIHAEWEKRHPTPPRLSTMERMKQRQAK
jgi:hypothetical protein